MSEKYLTPDEVMQRLNLTKSSLYRRVNDGTLPKPIKLGHLSRFIASEIQIALEELAQQRSAPAPGKGVQK
ncbi:AlpA family phage regulatory protein [Phaeobacter inhibens]|uniref:helix-turn-helix transcriptional regulator n=1 Tax=Phaeobacter inhibens TaxID=221822 RepID=UPI000160FB2C|nr:helix-turn-helix domain-containing protein [Phaeobacter inhibens]AXT41572.1 AlpA family phage regulatory protein [Phaeobacter inhibens]